jgi:hypothetical protein
MCLLVRKISYAEPTRLKKFFDAVNANAWTDENLLASLKAIFVALNELIQSDVEYYDNRRGQQRRLSTITRGGVIVFGTAGLLAPLLQNINPEFKNCVAYGYFSLGIAAAFLAGNRLFGATGGHIRYVMAQLDLGRLMTRFGLEWSQWLAKNRGLPPEEINIDEAFDLFKKVADNAYQIVQEETRVWGKSVSDALAEYEKSIGANKGSKDKPSGQAHRNHSTNNQTHSTGGKTHD